MTSLAQMAKCVGLSGGFSVVKQLFGYEAISTQFLFLGPISLSKQLSLLKRNHIHLNIILVGSESFTAYDRSVIDAGIQQVRNIYATINLGIGRVQHFEITNEEANGQQNIRSDDDARHLMEDYFVQNDGLDVMFVLSAWGSEQGLSPRPVTCDKSGKGMKGCVCVPQDIYLSTGAVVAHELGHCLGLEHVSDNNNLMFPFYPNGLRLTPSQAEIIMGHCSIRPPCQQ